MITLNDCYELRKRFDDYCNNAEQYEFPLLLKIDLKFQATVKHYEEVGTVDNQDEAEAMFRVVSKVIGENK